MWDSVTGWGSTNWRDLLSNELPEAMWLKFREVFDTVVNEFVPLQKRRVGQSLQCMWFNGKLR